MGEIVTFPSNGHEAAGYLATPAAGGGLGVVVIQEWWGLVDHIKDVCDRLAGEGFVALAPDLYHGSAVANSEPDEAGKLMMALNMDTAVKDMGGGADHLLSLESVTSTHVGTIGFCMGGGLALALAAARPDVVSACCPFYGIFPWSDLQPDWSKLEASILGHFAEKDSMFTPTMVGDLEDRLRAEGKEVDLIIHPATQHAFFNDSRPETHDPEASQKAWASIVPFLRANIT